MSKIANSQELKGLQVQLAKEQANSKVLKEEFSLAQRKFNQSQAAVKSLEARIIALQTEAPAPIVSEHALLRYLERHKGVNFDALREEILGEGTAKAIAFAKSGRIKKGNLSLVVKDNVVVTIE
jgi:hypothetical protein